MPLPSPYCGTYSLKTTSETMEPFPAQWRDTPKNRERWALLQNSNVYLSTMLQTRGVLQCHYCGKSPLRMVHWTDAAGQHDPYKVRSAG